MVLEKVCHAAEGRLAADVVFSTRIVAPDDPALQPVRTLLHHVVFARNRREGALDLGRMLVRVNAERLCVRFPIQQFDPVVCENSADGLRGLAVIELEHAAEPLTAAYWARSE
jgi:hypothetical protein